MDENIKTLTWIKSNYILTKIFEKLKRVKLLELITYNKKLKKRLNIKIDEYKDYSEKYSLIELEVILMENKYDKFINILKEDEPYYHIYFNNKKEEIKRYCINKDESVSRIKIIIDYQILSFQELFKNCKDLIFLMMNNHETYHS